MNALAKLKAERHYMGPIFGERGFFICENIQKYLAITVTRDKFFSVTRRDFENTNRPKS